MAVLNDILFYAGWLLILAVGGYLAFSRDLPRS